MEWIGFGSRVFGGMVLTRQGRQHRRGGLGGQEGRNRIVRRQCEHKGEEEELHDSRSSVLLRKRKSQILYRRRKLLLLMGARHDTEQLLDLDERRSFVVLCDDQWFGVFWNGHQAGGGRANGLKFFRRHVRILRRVFFNVVSWRSLRFVGR